MIKQIRIDDRLIHGQISTTWSKVLEIDAIVVANDEVAKDEIVKKVLLMGAPAGKKVIIRSVADTINLLKDPRAETLSILLIVKRPADAFILSKELNVNDINVANISDKSGEDRIRLELCVFVTKEEMITLKELCEIGKNVYSQVLPTNNKVRLINSIKKHLNK